MIKALKPKQSSAYEERGMHQRRFSSCLLLSTFAVAASYTSLAAAGTEHSGPGSSSLRWAACGEQYPGMECAVARVPLDYGDPEEGKIGIQLARFPGANATGTLFVNPGGPGGSGVDLVINGFGAYL